MAVGAVLFAVTQELTVDQERIVDHRAEREVLDERERAAEAPQPLPPQPDNPDAAAPRQPEAASAALNAVDAALERMIEGRVAFNTPERMMLHDVKGVHAILDAHLAEAELEALLEEPGPTETAQLRLSETMAAELSGLAFEVSPEGRQQQAISFSEPTDWRWQVKPIHEGTQSLHLKFFAVINVAGTDRTRHIETLDREIVVEVSAWDKTKQILAEFKWWWATVLVPAAGAYAWWRRRRAARADGQMA